MAWICQHWLKPNHWLWFLLRHIVRWFQSFLLEINVRRLRKRPSKIYPTIHQTCWIKMMDRVRRVLPTYILLYYIFDAISIIHLAYPKLKILPKGGRVQRFLWCYIFDFFFHAKIIIYTFVQLASRVPAQKRTSWDHQRLRSGPLWHQRSAFQTLGGPMLQLLNQLFISASCRT